MKLKKQNLKLLLICLWSFFNLPALAVSYGNTLEVTTQGQVLNATDFMLHEGAGTPDVITRVRVKNGVEFYIQLPMGHAVSHLDGGAQEGNRIKVSKAGTLWFRFSYNGKRYLVRSHVNYYGVLQYDGKDAPSDIGVVNSTDSRVGKEVNGVFYLSETESLFVPNHAFKDGMWWEGSLNKDNFVDLRDDQSTNQMSLKEILERAKSRVNGYTNSLNLRIQTNDGTSNGGVYSGSISPTVTITDLRQPAPSLEVSPNTLSFPENGGSQSVTVTSNQAWNASSNQTWVSVSPASGTNDGSFTVSVEPNTSQQPRTASITVTGGGLSKTITVNQAAALPDPVLELTPSSISAPANGKTEKVTVTSNQTWNASSNQTWVSVSPASGTNDGSFTVSVESNTSQQPRTASITVTGGGLSKTITVNQAAALPDPVLELTPSSISAPANGKTEKVTVTSNQTWNASSNQTWVSVSPASGTNDGSFTVSVEPNTSQQPRTASITVTGGGLSKTITVNQAAALPDPVLELTPSSISAPANGKTEKVTVTSNQTWNASSNQTWISVSPASGTNDGSFTVSVEPNTSQQSRTASITVTGGGLKKEIAITQAGEQVITPPTNFKSETLYQRDAIISWSAAGSETEWEVNYGDHKITVNEPKATLRGLTPNTEVTAQIRAKINGKLSEPLVATLRTEDFTAIANRIPHLYGMKESFAVGEMLPIFWKDLEHLPSAITYNLSITSTPENDTKLFAPLPEAIQFTEKGSFVLTIKFEGHEEFEEISYLIEVK